MSSRNENIGLLALFGIVIMSLSTIGKQSLEPVYLLPVIIGFCVLMSAVLYGVYHDVIGTK